MKRNLKKNTNLQNKIYNMWRKKYKRNQLKDLMGRNNFKKDKIKFRLVSKKYLRNRKQRYLKKNQLKNLKKSLKLKTKKKKRDIL